MKKIAAAVALMVAPVVCFAGDRNYQCQVGEEWFLDPAGTLSRVKKSVEAGGRFAVDRMTGEVIGGPFVRAPITKTTLVNGGGSGSAFKAVYITLGDMEVLQIREYDPGPEKAFVAITLLTVFAGICR